MQEARQIAQTGRDLPGQLVFRQVELFQVYEIGQLCGYLATEPVVLETQEH